MGQAFRRASARIRSTSLDSPPSSSAKKAAADIPPPAAPPSKFAGGDVSADSVAESRNHVEDVLEKRDPQFDAMLGQLVGRISSKAGGKPEMSEAVGVKYKRPLPKLRNTTTESSRYEEVSVPTGTLNVAQLRHIILLHQGKADDHDGPMDIPQIAEKFRVDVVKIQKILQHVSLPSDDSHKQKNDK